jgi:hypothetical protein
LLAPNRFAARRQSDQAGARVVRIGAQRHQALGGEFVDDALHALPGEAHGPRQARHGFRYRA